MADLKAIFFVLDACFRNGCLNASGIKRQPKPSGFHAAVLFFVIIYLCVRTKRKVRKRTQKEKKEEIFCDVPVSHKHKNKIKRISLQTYGALDAPHDLIDRSNLTTTKLPLLS